MAHQDAPRSILRVRKILRKSASYTGFWRLPNLSFFPDDGPIKTGYPPGPPTYKKAAAGRRPRGVTETVSEASGRAGRRPASRRRRWRAAASGSSPPWTSHRVPARRRPPDRRRPGAASRGHRAPPGPGRRGSRPGAPACARARGRHGPSADPASGLVAVRRERTLDGRDVPRDRRHAAAGLHRLRPALALVGILGRRRRNVDRRDRRHAVDGRVGGRQLGLGELLRPVAAVAPRQLVGGDPVLRLLVGVTLGGRLFGPAGRIGVELRMRAGVHDRGRLLVEAAGLVRRRDLDGGNARLDAEARVVEVLHVVVDLDALALLLVAQELGDLVVDDERRALLVRREPGRLAALFQTGRERLVWASMARSEPLGGVRAWIPATLRSLTW